MQCTQILKSYLKLPLTEVDKVVVNSKAWESNYDTVNDLRDSIFNIDFKEEEE